VRVHQLRILVTVCADAGEGGRAGKHVGCGAAEAGRLRGHVVMVVVVVGVTMAVVDVSMVTCVVATVD
jgi:hypothetical protein